MMELKTVKVEKPEEVNFILGQAHFIKTVEDLHEALVSAVPGIKFGLAFCESSGPALIRTSGTDKKLLKLAQESAGKIACGHCFLIFLDETYPINVLSKIKKVDEVVTVFCATANQVKVIIGEEGNGRSILGVIDGVKSKKVESNKDIKERKKFLRKIGYKL